MKSARNRDAVLVSHRLPRLLAAVYYSAFGCKESPRVHRVIFPQNAGVMKLLVNELVGHRDLSTAMSASADADSIMMIDGVSLSKAILSKEVSYRGVTAAYLDSHPENQSQGKCDCRCKIVTG